MPATCPVTTLPPAGAAAPARHLGPQGAVGQFVVGVRVQPHRARRPDRLPRPAGHVAQPRLLRQRDAPTRSPRSTPCSRAHELPEPAGHGVLLGAHPARPWRAGHPDARHRLLPRRARVDPTEVVPFPPGFKIIAGDMTATAEDPRPLDIAGWSCGVTTSAVPRAAELPGERAAASGHHLPRLLGRRARRQRGPPLPRRHARTASAPTPPGAHPAADLRDHLPVSGDRPRR